MARCGHPCRSLRRARRRAHGDARARRRRLRPIVRTARPAAASRRPQRDRAGPAGLRPHPLAPHACPISGLGRLDLRPRPRRTRPHRAARRILRRQPWRLPCVSVRSAARPRYRSRRHRDHLGRPAHTARATPVRPQQAGTAWHDAAAAACRAAGGRPAVAGQMVYADGRNGERRRAEPDRFRRSMRRQRSRTHRVHGVDLCGAAGHRTRAVRRLPGVAGARLPTAGRRSSRVCRSSRGCERRSSS